MRAHALRVSGCPTILETNVLSFNPPQLSESFLERICARSRIHVALRDAHQHTNSPQSFALLRPYHERPRRRTTNQRNELPPFHSTTS
jgi:hypothetical protein